MATVDGRRFAGKEIAMRTTATTNAFDVLIARRSRGWCGHSRWNPCSSDALSESE